MGGRGGSSGIRNEKPVSRLLANTYYNSAKKSDALRGSGTVSKDSKIEKAIKTENTDYFASIKTKNEAVRTMNYLYDRVNESTRKIAKLGSGSEVFKNQKIAIEHRKLLSAKNAMADAMHKFVKAEKQGNISALHDPNRATTTYNNARKRRIANYDAWFFGGRK